MIFNVFAGIILMKYWRGDRVAECAGLENRCRRKATVGSNPTLSAMYHSLRSDTRQASSYATAIGCPPLAEGFGCLATYAKISEPNSKASDGEPSIPCFGLQATNVNHLSLGLQNYLASSDKLFAVPIF